MKGFFEKACTAKESGTSSSNSSGIDVLSGSSDTKSSNKGSVLSRFLVSAFSVFETHSQASPRDSKAAGSRGNGWTAAVKRIVASGSMRRVKEQILGLCRTNFISSTGDIWLLGVCYKVDDSADGDPASTVGFAAFIEDFSSRILLTYRKGFDPTGDSKYTSDVNWGCMLRSSQMLLAQALVVHRFGRSWRRTTNKQLDQGYIEILHQFGDSEESAFSIHNLLQAGKAYGLAAGSWVGPYAMCRTWESLARGMKEVANEPLPMVIHIVSGDEDGERGGAPIICIEDVARHCLEHSGGKADWTPILLLVPLVVGLDKVNPRYVPLLRATFMFPQSLGVLGGKPGASTYIVGVQDENAFYLDPHEVQPVRVVMIDKDNVEVDTSSYHCNVLRNLPLDSIDPSLAIGFYCRDKDDFDDFCSRASKLTDESDGAPLFTVAQTRSSPKQGSNPDMVVSGPGEARVEDSYDMASSATAGDAREDEWQLL
ncbi:Cysteine protease atg4 [Ancistrocladus abbreviatus]